MKIGIIGLAQTGKKTFYEVLTQHKISEQEISSGKAIKGVCEVRDERFDKFVEIYKPKKQVRARLDIELLPRIEKDTITKGDIFKDIIELDAICHIVRAFEDDAIYHVDGSVDPVRDIENINSELILNDMLFIEKRFERIDAELKKARDNSIEKEKELLTIFRSQLDKNMPLRLLELSAEQKKIISGYPFITMKKMVIVLNVSESNISDISQLQAIKERFSAIGAGMMQACAKAEAEIALLDDQKDRSEFLQALGIEEPAINKLTQLCIKALDLISFFTVGEDEVRQWTTRKGSAAPQAAGTIHTDLEKGFIRAEVMKAKEFFEYGDKVKLKEAGKWYLKGKDYIVEDGDMLDIRFNV